MELEVSEGGEGQGMKEERDEKGKKGGHTMTATLKFKGGPLLSSPLQPRSSVLASMLTLVGFTYIPMQRVSLFSPCPLLL